MIEIGVDVRRAIVGEGNFEIFEDGTIFKIKRDGTKTEANIRYLKQRNKEYPLVNYTTKEGKKGCLCVHRLIAEAFLPNPEQKKFVLFKNGNPREFGVDNLVWDNGSLLHKRKMDKLLQNQNECPTCGKTLDKKKGCTPCRIKEIKEQKALRNQLRKLKKIRNDLAAINIDNLNYEYKKIITMRRAGKSLTEIGKEVNESSVKVRQIIESIKKDQRKMSQQPRATLNQKNHSEILDEETNQLRRMFIFGEGGSARYFYGE